MSCQFFDISLIFDFIKSNLDLLGLTLNLIGTLLLTFYVSTDPYSYYEDEPSQKVGEKWHSVIIKSPKFLSFGLGFIFIGFVVSILDKFIK